MSSLDHSIPVPAISRAFEVVESSSNNKTATHSINVNEDDGDGVFLTWQDLWVTVPDGQKKGNRSILQGLTGYARPGELLAIMGPSGCGKSTLLDALAGRLGSNTRQAGEILINGRKRALAYGTSAYVTQDDALITTLTVSEAVYYSAQLQLPDTMTKLQKKERAEMTIKEMGLQDAMNTRIGGWGAKGLSGGQKRRVSICIEMLTRPKLLFLDEPTSGLDSAASYYVMSRIAKLDQRDHGVGSRTIIASIHQPSSEVFQLFHNLCLLSSGQTVYFGPASAANEFFALNGFPCPTLQNPSDHFLKTINKDFQEDIEEGLAGVIPTEEAIDILTKSYKSSDNYLQVRSQVAEICKAQARGSLLMFVASYLTFMTIGGFPSFVEDMKVFERERLNGHYGATAFVFGNTFSALPYLALISLIPGAIVYYLPGLHEGYQHFIYFVLLLFACMLLVESLMMIVASLVPNYLTGIITGAGIQGLMILGGGFFRLPNDLPHPFWKYPLYYIAFHKYAYQGMFKNEFEGLKFDNNLDGEQVLRDKWQLQMGYSKWVDLAILFGMVVFYRLVFLGIIKTVEKMKPVVKAFMSVPMKQTTQIMENPCATPPQEDKIFYQ
ncbi:ABC transporter domain-containing protein [Citrus sinensis]|uniref:ABC transporter domain-containing protein n=1 Tax=Citrus sinensis TaxID=2711 RepID=A0ACB8IKT3_CITSI|nr:ABC transporter domain-containing protein [Citrus sinensis]